MSAEATISRLKIITETQSGEAIKGLTRLASALSALKKSAGNASFRGLDNAAAGLKNLAAAIDAIPYATVAKLERMSKAVMRMNNARIAVNTYKKMKEAYEKYAAETGETDPKGGETPPKLPKAPSPDKKKATKEAGFVGKLFKSILRIAGYRLIRRALQVIVQSIAEGYRNAVEWARVNDHYLYQSVQKVATASLVMKNQLGAAALQLMDTFAPALIKLADITTDIADKFANLFAVLGNEDTYLKAKRDIDAVTKAQNALNKSLLSFDEINKLNGNNQYGVSIDDMFDPAPTDKAEAAGTALGTAAAIAAAAALANALKGGGSGNGNGGGGSALGGGIIGGTIVAAGKGLAKGALKLGVLAYNGASKLGGLAASGGATGGSALAGTSAAASVLAPFALAAEVATVTYLGYEHFKEQQKKLEQGMGYYYTPKELNPVQQFEFGRKMEAAGLFPNSYVGTGEDTIIEVRITDDKGNVTDTKTLALDDIINRRVGHIYAGAVAATR